MGAWVSAVSAWVSACVRVHAFVGRVRALFMCVCSIGPSALSVRSSGAHPSNGSTRDRMGRGAVPLASAVPKSNVKNACSNALRTDRMLKELRPECGSFFHQSMPTANAEGSGPDLIGSPYQRSGWRGLEMAPN